MRSPRPADDTGTVATYLHPGLIAGTRTYQEEQQMKAPGKTSTAIALTVIASTIGVASAATGATGARTATERITLTGTSAGTASSPIRVLATGPIKGVGTARIKSGPNHTEPTTLRLPNGTVHAIAIQTSQTVHLNRQKCTATNDSRGTLTITGGTRAFRGARGHLTYHTHAFLVGARSPSGACLGKRTPPNRTSITSTAAGTATLP
jgi:hypothetical protein